MTTEGVTRPLRRRPRPRALLGMRPRVLGWYALLLTLALAVTLVITFRQGEQAQQRVVEDELREEVIDLQSALQAGQGDGRSLAQAVASYVASWSPEDRDTIVIRLGDAAPLAAGPIGADPALAGALAGVREPRLESIRTRRGRARALVTPLRLDGRAVGGVVAARLTDSESSALLERRIAVALAALVAFLAASAVAWFTLGRLLRPVREMAATADAIAAEGDLGRRIEAPPQRDEVGTLARTLNRMLARLEAAFRREQRFIREASHELRTPITICRGHLEVLGDDPKPEEMRETVAVVVDELGRMGRIVDDMTTLARVEDPAFLRLEEIDLDAFLAEIGRAAEPLVAGRLTVAGGAGGARVRADRHRLAQALLNLLQNATLHGDRAGPVELRLAPEPGAWRFEVADRGGGLPAGEEERLFRPFARASTRAAGSGLGLAIVRGIAEAHGGAAGVDNRPGEGATFWLRVPA